MRQFLTIFQVVLSILLILMILIQEKGVGLSSTFGGGGEFYKSKRGIDRVFFIITVVLSILFILTAVSFIFVK